jgi:UDP-glucuronate 4-epimerase
MKKALVTGCAGFIGSHLTEKLLEEGWDVTGLDNFHQYYDKKLKIKNLEFFLKNKNFTFYEGSILSEPDLESLNSEFDCIFHLAAIAGVRNSIENPDEYFRINKIGTKNLLEKFSKVKKFVFASSSSVYGDIEKHETPVKEDHPLNPISPYGESKKQAEEICQEFSKTHSIQVVILRFYTVFGPRQRPDEAITKFIRLAIDDKPIPIYGDGSKERDYTFVSDIVNGIILAEKNGNGIYNLGSSIPISINKMVSTIEQNLNKKIQKDYLASPPGDVEITHADISKAKNEIHYFPKTNFEDGIKASINWCKESSN